MRLIYPVSDQEREHGLSHENLRACLQTFHRQGCLLLRDLIAPAEVEALKASYYGRFGERDIHSLAQIGYPVGHLRLLHPLLLEGAFARPQFYAHPLLHPLLQALLGQRMVLNSASVVVAFPGSEEQRLHRDIAPLFGNSPICAQTPAYGITVVIPLVELNPQNGTTRLAVGSHHDTRTAYTYEGHPAVFYPDCRLGDAFLMDFRLVHGGTDNFSQQPRPIIYLSYTRTWFIDLENTIEMEVPALAMTEQAFKQVPEEYASLMVYARLRPHPLRPEWQQIYAESEAEPTGS